MLAQPPVRIAPTTNLSAFISISTVPIFGMEGFTANPPVADPLHSLSVIADWLTEGLAFPKTSVMMTHPRGPLGRARGWGFR